MPMSPRDRFSTLYRLFSHVVRWQPSVILTTLLGMLSSALELIAMASLVPLSQLATHQPIAPHSIWYRVPAAMGVHPDVQFYVIAFLTLILLRALSSSVTLVFTTYTYRKLISHFSSSGLKAFVRHLSFQQVNQSTIGHFMTLAGDEANRASQMVMSTMRLVPIVTLLFLYVGLIFYQAWTFGLGMVLFFVVTLVSLIGAFRKSHQLGKRQQEESRTLNTHFIESLSGLRTVRGFNGEAFVSDRYREMIEGYVWTCFLVDFLNIISRAAPALLLMVGLLLSSMFLLDRGWLATNLPLVFVGSMMVMRLLPIAGQALEAMLRLASDLRATTNVSEMLEAITVADAGNSVEIDLPGAPIQKITFDNVSFRYSDDTPMVLEHYSTSFERGRSYAITGPSGSGKSSLVDLLLKFYEPQGGHIRIDGQDLSRFSSFSLRSRVVLVEQTTRVFYDTIAQNVRFGRDGTLAQVAHALESVGLSGLIADLPQGTETMVNFQGSNLSGGQKQRLGLARGILHAADVLILDESTNALDAATRENVLNYILDRCRDRIVIFVTHDVQVLSRVDHVIEVAARRQPAVQAADL